MRVVFIPGEYILADLLTKTKITGNIIHGMVKPIICNKSAVIREMVKTKWKESNQNVGPLVSNTIKYLLHYQR